MKSFTCSHCKKEVPVNKFIGTLNRNHCPFCLWSKHMDLQTPGDRKSLCKKLMRPIGLTFKEEGFDKWGKKKQGELMIIHECIEDNKISINRIAGDDDPETILKIFTDSQSLSDEKKSSLKNCQINLLNNQYKDEILKQLYGKLKHF